MPAKSANSSFPNRWRHTSHSLFCVWVCNQSNQTNHMLHQLWYWNAQTEFWTSKWRWGIDNHLRICRGVSLTSDANDGEHQHYSLSQRTRLGVCWSVWNACRKQRYSVCSWNAGGSQMKQCHRYADGQQSVSVWAWQRQRFAHLRMPSDNGQYLFLLAFDELHLSYNYLDKQNCSKWERLVNNCFYLLLLYFCNSMITDCT